MKIAICEGRLKVLLERQLKNNFLLEEEEKKQIKKFIGIALERSEECFAATTNKYYRKESEIYFNPYHSAQYCIFLYYLSNSSYKSLGNNPLSDKIYYLNKMLNAVDLYYEVELPSIFFTDHPVGSVLGRAKYGDYFSFSQNCTVGNNKGIYPVLGNHVKMSSGSSILGNCHIGNNVILGAGAIIKDQSIDDNSIVFGESPNLVIKSYVDLSK